MRELVIRATSEIEIMAVYAQYKQDREQYTVSKPVQEPDGRWSVRVTEYSLD